MDRENLRLLYLEAMGIQAWIPRFEAGTPAGHAALDESAIQQPESTPSEAPAPEEHAAAWAESFSAWAVETPPTAEPPRAAEIRGLDWDELEFRVAKCQACALHRTRTQTVFGVGNRSASWMIVGEAPGEQEDLKGEPFVGRAGQLLNEMLRAIGLSREAVYIANILKCRPPKNRDPEPAETESCEPFLQRQVSLINPSIILAAGRIATQNLLKTATPIGKLRGTVHRYQGIPLVVTYHPAYLLRSPLEKRKAWADLQLAVKTFNEQQLQEKPISSCSTGSIG